MQIMEQDQGTFQFEKQHNSVINEIRSTDELEYEGQGKGDKATAGGAKSAKGYRVKLGPKIRKQKPNLLRFRVGSMVAHKGIIFLIRMLVQSQYRVRA